MPLSSKHGSRRVKGNGKTKNAWLAARRLFAYHQEENNPHWHMEYPWTRGTIRKDSEGKLRCITNIIAERQWNVAVLTNLRFPDNGFKEIIVGGSTWLLIHHGRVGVALDPFFC